MDRISVWRRFAAALCIAAAPFAHAEPAAQPYAGHAARTVKSLSDEQVRALRAGQGMGLALPAELASYPGPLHVLELADALGLSDAQRDASRALMAPMRQAAVHWGTQWIAKEQEIDALFAEGRATPALLQARLAEAAQLQAQVRLAHLETHIRQAALLTPAQIARYNTLRGYAAPGDAGRDAPAHAEHGAHGGHGAHGHLPAMNPPGVER